MLSYATVQLGVPRNIMLTGLMLGSMTMFVVTGPAGALADRCGARAIGLTGAFVSFLLAFPFFCLIDTGSPVLILMAMSFCVIGNSWIYAVSGALTAELFPARLRYSGISFSPAFLIHCDLFRVGEIPREHSGCAHSGA